MNTSTTTRMIRKKRIDSASRSRVYSFEMTSLTIGQVAKKVGISVESIRFYEREKLIACPPRRISGYRQYPAKMVSEILFIRQAKEMGFSLREIADLLVLRSDPLGAVAEVKQKAVAKIRDIDSKIKSLQEIRDELVSLTSACKGHGSKQECPIMKALESKTESIRSLND